MNLYKKSTAASLGLALLASVVAAPPARALTGGLQFTQLTTQSYAATGQTGYNGNTWSSLINDFTFDGDNLIAGYGDWNFNSDSWGGPNGRTGIQPYNLNTNQWGTNMLDGSEANTVFRTINGHIYAPSTDPSIYGSGGYASNVSGTWQVYRPAGLSAAVHVMDIASPDNSDKNLIVFGSEHRPGQDNDEGKATAWISHDYGATWNVLAEDVSADMSQMTDMERYYWGAPLNGKVYFQAMGISPRTPMRVYDLATDTVTDLPFQPDCNNYTADTKFFDGKVTCGYDANTNSVVLFDGASTSKYQIPNTNQGIYFTHSYIDNGYFYIMYTNGVIYRTSSWDKPAEYVGKTSDIGYISALGVHNDKIYLGMGGGKIYASTTTITDMQKIVPQITGVTPATFVHDGKVHVIKISGSNFANGAVVKVGGIAFPTVYGGENTLTVQVNDAQLPTKDSGATTQAGQVSTMAVNDQYTVTVVNPFLDGGTVDAVNALTATTVTSVVTSPTTTPTTTSNTPTSTTTEPDSPTPQQSTAEASAEKLAHTGADTRLLAIPGLAVIVAGVWRACKKALY